MGEDRSLSQAKQDLTPEDHQRRGLELLERGQGPDALAHLSRAYLTNPQSARYRSSYALALALVRRQFLGAVELARAAIRQEFYNPELYQNLARIHLAFDCKAEAIRFLKRGLMVDPEHEALQKLMAGLGVRRRAPLRFLPRSHLVNRLLGRLQARRWRPRSTWVGSAAQRA